MIGSTDVFVWKNKNMNTMSAIMDEISKITDPQEAKDFMRAYEETTDSHVARSNIGYMTGYLSREEANRICDLFEVEHPILGRKEWTPEEIFKKGMELGELSKIHGAEKALQMLKDLGEFE